MVAALPGIGDFRHDVGTGSGGSQNSVVLRTAAGRAQAHGESRSQPPIAGPWFDTGSRLTMAHQLRAILPAPAPTYAPQRPPGTLRPGGARDLSGPSAACAG